MAVLAWIFLGGLENEAYRRHQKFEDVQSELQKQEEKHEREVKRIESEIAELRRRVREYEETEPRSIGFNDSSTDSFVRTVEWTIKNFKNEEKLCPKGTPMWSPRFKLAGINEVRLEFLPNGREKSWNGFCSLFLWCPPGTKIRYQLWVGSFIKAPDEDTYDGEVGHGHSNFCPLDPEIDLKSDSVTVGCNIFEVMTTYHISERNLTLYAWPLQHWVKKEAEVLENRGVKSINWKVKKVGQALHLYQRGASMMEFYPNGCAATKKDGFCSLYVRCPEKVVLILTLIVGTVKKGPIKTTFDTASGKGLPDFCKLEEQINDDDTVDVGIELQSRPSASVLTLTT